ncbi:MAG: DUF1643 domain-containing protein [Planctomycetota bacterium]
MSALQDMQGAATFDSTRVYRYSLLRVWNDDAPRCCFVALNPSTADAQSNDPTVRRCIGYAQDWGYGSLEVVNIFSLRSTDPAVLRTHPDPVGPGNDRAIRRAASRAALVVAAWGSHGTIGDRDARVLRLLRAVCTPMALALTAAGQPRHPLYLRADLRPAPL